MAVISSTQNLANSTSKVMILGWPLRPLTTEVYFALFSSEWYGCIMEGIDCHLELERIDTVADDSFCFVTRRIITH